MFTTNFLQFESASGEPESTSKITLISLYEEKAEIDDIEKGNEVCTSYNYYPA